jgi:hypothetical protein
MPNSKNFASDTHHLTNNVHLVQIFTTKEEPATYGGVIR